MNASIHIRLRNTLLKQKSLKTKFTNKSGIFIMPKKKDQLILMEYSNLI